MVMSKHIFLQLRYIKISSLISHYGDVKSVVNFTVLVSEFLNHSDMELLY